MPSKLLWSVKFELSHGLCTHPQSGSGIFKFLWVTRNGRWLVVGTHVVGASHGLTKLSWVLEIVARAPALVAVADVVPVAERPRHVAVVVRRQVGVCDGVDIIIRMMSEGPGRLVTHRRIVTQRARKKEARENTSKKYFKENTGSLLLGKHHD